MKQLLCISIVAIASLYICTIDNERESLFAKKGFVGLSHIVEFDELAKFLGAGKIIKSGSKKIYAQNKLNYNELKYSTKQMDEEYHFLGEKVSFELIENKFNINKSLINGVWNDPNVKNKEKFLKYVGLVLPLSLLNRDDYHLSLGWRTGEFVPGLSFLSNESRRFLEKYHLLNEQKGGDFESNEVVFYGPIQTDKIQKIIVCREIEEKTKELVKKYHYKIEIEGFNCHLMSNMLKKYSEVPDL